MNETEKKYNVRGYLIPAIVTGLIGVVFGALSGTAGSVAVLGERIARLEAEMEHVKSQQNKFSDTIDRLEIQIKNLELITTLKGEVERLKEQVGSLSVKLEAQEREIAQLRTKTPEKPPVPKEVGVWADKIKFKSPDGKYGATIVGEGADRHYEVIDIETGQIVLTTHAQYSTPNEVKTGIFSPDSKKFAAAYHYGHEGGYTWIGIWDLESGSLDRSKRASGWTTDIKSVFDK